MIAKLGFAFYFQPGSQERYALIFCRSIRLYGGKNKQAPIYALIPAGEEYKLQEENISELKGLNVDIIPFELTRPKETIYYIGKSVAAGAAEAHATGEVEQLIYSDVEALFLNDPTLMMLDPKKKLGVRPVDIKNIGLTWNEPLDDFWKDVFTLCEVPEQAIFPVISTVESDKLRAYFNACLLTVRPENGLLQKWSANIVKLMDNPAWNKHFTTKEDYRIFLHQAILTATLLKELDEADFEIYPIYINFPLFFYPRHPHKPEWINELITCRLDMLDTDNCWKNWLPMREPLRSWLIGQYEDLQLDSPLPDQI